MNNLNTSVSGRSRISDTHTCCSPEFSRNQSVFWPRCPPWRRQRREPWDVRAVGVPAAPSGRLTCPTSSTSSSPEMGQSNMQKAPKMGQIHRTLVSAQIWESCYHFTSFWKQQTIPNHIPCSVNLPVLGARRGHWINIGLAGIFDVCGLPWKLVRQWEVPTLGFELGKAKLLVS